MTYDREKQTASSDRYGGGYEYDPFGRPSSSSSSAWGSDRSRWDPRERFREPTPQPQPQRQKQESDGSSPRRQYTGIAFAHSCATNMTESHSHFSLMSLSETDDHYDDLMRKWRQQQLEQGATKDLRSQRKSQNERESSDIWAEFDSYGNLASPESNQQVRR